MANGAVLGILNRGGQYDYLWDYLDSLTLKNYKIGCVNTDGSGYYNWQFSIKFPFDADMEITGNATFFYTRGGSSYNQPTVIPSRFSGISTSYDTSTSILTVDFSTTEVWEQADGSTDMGFTFSEITFNRK